MPLLRTSDDQPDADQRLKNALTRNFEGACGLLLIAIAAMIAAMLATWSVEDPSWSHATTGPVRNVLGEPGAILSDLAMQFIGLASVLVPLPLVFWGWRLINGSPARPARRAGLAWLASVVIGAGFFACLPVSAAWPLPLGLGGVIGDWILKVPLLVAGAGADGIVKVVAGLLLGGAMLSCVVHACGLSVRHLRSEAGRARRSLMGRKKPAEAHEPAFDIDDFEDDGYDDDAEQRQSLLSRASTGLGALFHWTLMARAQLRRATGSRPAPQKPDRPTSWVSKVRESLLEPDDGLDEFYSGDRAEPAFGRGNAMDPGGAIDPGYGDYDGLDDDLVAEVPPPGNAGAGLDVDEPAVAQPRVGNPAAEQPGLQTAPPRVTQKAPPAKPGKRVIREAQGSLLAPEEFEFPPLHVLSEPKALRRDASMSNEALEQNARILEGVLEDFGVRGDIINVRPGPVVTLYELEPAPGIKSSRVIGLADDIARSMSAISARVAVIPGKNAIGIELPNPRRETVYLRESLASEQFEKSKAKLALCLGKTIGGEPVIADLARMPHLLVAGTTGSGKSVAINTMIASLLYRLKPDECKLIMVDPKMLELSVYDGIPHLQTPVVTDPKKAVVALKWTVREMEDRYKKMSKLGVRNIDGYNNRVRQAEAKGEVITRTIQTGFDRETGEAIYEQEELDLSPMPFIVVIVDEMADLMIVAGKDIEGAIQRLAQMARAAGIHIIMATQRPSVDVITGTIKANFPTRISFQVTSKIDSRTILGEQGAEQLLGMGDMLYMAGGGRIQRVHGPFVSDDEVEKVVNHLKSQGVPQYLEAITDEDEVDPGSADEAGGGEAEGGDLYEQAVAIVLRDKKASTSYVQRRLSIGYNRAASIIERMEQEGLIGPANHAGKREILVETGDEM
ncbi:MAG: DNA translocase FtsK [Pseudomonadota bacterium]